MAGNSAVGMMNGRLTTMKIVHICSAFTNDIIVPEGPLQVLQKL
jgi:hypothetical protein